MAMKIPKAEIPTTKNVVKSIAPTKFSVVFMLMNQSKVHAIIDAPKIP